MKEGKPGLAFPLLLGSSILTVRKKNIPRKAQQKKTVLNKIFLVVILFCCLVLLFSSFGGRFGLFHQLTLESLGPVQGLAKKISGGIEYIWHDYIKLWEIRDENRRLKKTLSEYDEKLSEYLEAYSIYLNVTEQLDYKKKNTFPSVTALVVGRDPSYWFQTIIVNRGEDDSVFKGMVARTEKGVVGQVIQVSPNYAKILLANAPSSAIDAIIQKNRVRGILKGAGKSGYVLYYVLKNADVKIGDRVVTAGIGGIFPSGILLGHVKAVHKKQRGMFQEIEVEPSVDFQRLETVFINLTEKLSWQAEFKNSAEEEE